MNTGTRIKICGITREADFDACIEVGVDALGFVFYAGSPRCISAARVAELLRRLPPFVAGVGLFVNPAPAEVEAVLAAAPIDLLQFHGDEPEAFCASFGRPYLKAARVRPGFDLVQFAAAYPSARGILCDAFVEGYGGGGKTFDWALVPAGLPKPLVLSGGLSPDNVGEGIRRLRPFAVDVSSGVEAAKGIKDSAKIAAFIERVRETDESLRSA